MNLSELVKQVHTQVPELSHEQVKRSLELINETIVDSLARQNRVEIRGFGSFFLSRRVARHVRNPRTGKNFYVPQCWVPRYKAGKSLREFIDSGQEKQG